jgi:hypothetical protein
MEKEYFDWVESTRMLTKIRFLLPFWQRCMHVSPGIQIGEYSISPLYNVCLYISRMPSQHLALTSILLDIGFVASHDGHAITSRSMRLSGQQG